MDESEEGSECLEFLSGGIVLVHPRFAELPQSLEVAFRDVGKPVLLGECFQLFEEQTVFVDAGLAESAGLTVPNEGITGFFYALTGFRFSRRF